MIVVSSGFTHGFHLSVLGGAIPNDGRVQPPPDRVASCSPSAAAAIGLLPWPPGMQRQGLAGAGPWQPWLALRKQDQGHLVLTGGNW